MILCVIYHLSTILDFYFQIDVILIQLADSNKSKFRYVPSQKYNLLCIYTELLPPTSNNVGGEFGTK